MQNLASETAKLEPLTPASVLRARYHGICQRTLKKRAKEAGVRGLKMGRELLFRDWEIKRLDAVAIERAGGEADELPPIAASPGARARVRTVRRQQQRRHAKRVAQTVRKRLAISGDRKVIAVDFTRQS